MPSPPWPVVGLGTIMLSCTELLPHPRHVAGFTTCDTPSDGAGHSDFRRSVDFGPSFPPLLLYQTSQNYLLPLDAPVCRGQFVKDEMLLLPGVRDSSMLSAKPTTTGPHLREHYAFTHVIVTSPSPRGRFCHLNPPK